MKANSDLSLGERPCFGRTWAAQERCWASRSGGVAAPPNAAAAVEGPPSEERRAMPRFSSVAPTPHRHTHHAAPRSQLAAISLTQCRTLLSWCVEIWTDNWSCLIPQIIMEGRSFVGLLLILAGPVFINGQSHSISLRWCLFFTSIPIFLQQKLKSPQK